MKFNWKIKLLLFLVMLIVGVLIAAPIIGKNYFNDHSEELLGRNAHLNSLGINYFKGSVELAEFIIYEDNKKDTFLFLNHLYINANVLACLGGNYTLEDLLIDGIQCHIAIDHGKANFDSLVDHFASDSTAEEPPSDTTQVQYAVQNFNLQNSRVSYSDLNLGNEIVVKNLAVSLPEGLYWDKPEIHAKTGFSFASGGAVKTDLWYNTKKEGYRVDLDVDQLDLGILLPYIQDFMWVSKFQGMLNLDLSVAGNNHDPSDVNLLGKIGLNKLLLTDQADTKVMALGGFSVAIDSLNAAKELYEIESIHINSPFLRFAMDSLSDNISDMIKHKDTTTVVAAVVEDTSSSSNVFLLIRDYFKTALHDIKASNYSIDTFLLEDLSVRYIDHTLLEPFEYVVSETGLKATGIRSDADSLLVLFNAVLNSKGKMSMDAILHPKAPEDVNVQLNIHDVSMKDLSPWFYEYVAFPVLGGSFEMNCNLVVLDSQLHSKNYLLLERFKLGKKEKHPEAMDLPLRLAISILKNRDGNIELDLPVEGNLADPEYKIGKVVWGIFKELIVKAAVSPYKAISGKGGDDEEETRKLVFKNAFDSISTKQQHHLGNLAKVLLENPQLGLQLDAQYNPQREIAELTLVKAKAEYLNILSENGYSPQEWDRIKALKKQNPEFVAHLNQQLNQNQLELSVDEKVAALYPADQLRSKIELALEEKVKQVHDYLLSQEVPEVQLSLINPKMSPLYPDGKIDRVEFHLLFEVLEEETSSTP